MTDLDVVTEFLAGHVPAHGGTEACRHGGCVELAEEFKVAHDDAELWEIIELFEETGYPLQLTVENVREILGGRELYDCGATGAHMVVIWRGIVFDAAGPSTLESITRVFKGLVRPHWVCVG